MVLVTVLSLFALVFSLTFLLALGTRPKVLQTHPIQALRSVSRELFSCFLEKDYPQKLYLYERRFHLAKQHYWQLKNKDGQLEALFACLMECALLRWRVSDHTVFALCREELKAIAASLDRWFETRQAADMAAYQEALHQLEGCFHHVLKVAAREPVAFSLFLHSLMALGEAMAAYV